jgi:hypothetical protein
MTAREFPRRWVSPRLPLPPPQAVKNAANKAAALAGAGNFGMDRVVNTRQSPPSGEPNVILIMVEFYQGHIPVVRNLINVTLVM